MKSELFYLADKLFIVEDDPGPMFLRMVQNGYDFERKEWDNIDRDAIDLVKNMLKFSMNDRLSMSQVLQHKWLRNGRRPSNNHLAQTLIRMDEFRKRQHRVHTVQSIYQARQRLKQEITQRPRQARGTGGLGQSRRNILRGVQKYL